MLKKIIAVGLLAFIAYQIYRYTVFGGYHITVYNHYPGPCRQIANIDHGSEDMVLLPGDKALISSGFRGTMRNNPLHAESTASIFLFDFNQPQKPVQRVTLSGFHRKSKECDFLGMSLWIEEETGIITIFIVNHLETESVVEIFHYDEKQMNLIHQETIGSRDPNFHFLNDIEAVGPRQFYTTNALYGGKFTSLEIKLLLRWGSVVYFDGSKTHFVTDERFLFTNGIASSPDGSLIYVSNMGEREIVTFIRNKDNSLTFKERTPLYSLPDNILVERKTGDLWVGCHTVGHRLMEHLANPQTRAPSQVLHLRTENGIITNITEVLADDGNLIQASSVALYHKKQILIGTVYSNMFVCDVKYI